MNKGKKLSNKDIEKLCLDLVKSESEKEVVRILEKHELWNSAEYWQYYGGLENNFSSIGNQQEKADSALVEKLINSADALLVGEALKRGVNPESESAPASISEALREYFNIPEGVLANMSNARKNELAKKIGLVATGSKSRPNFSIYDFGMGQSPHNFPETFLSLNKSNKIKIPFVQGKFNMGSTGVLQFCSKEHNLQLIVSRMASHNQATQDEELWGFTIVKREKPFGNMKSSSYKYLAPFGKILSFKSSGLPILPDGQKTYSKKLDFGSYVKLYEYNIGPGLRTNILFDLFNRLNLLMPEASIPVRLYEQRSYRGHTLETTLSGLASRLENERTELEENFPFSITFPLEDSTIKASVYAFKVKDGKNYKGNYAKSEGVVFSVNGQAHGFLDKKFYKRKNLKLDYLADSLLIIVDCSEISGASREDLFMNSRDRLREGTAKKTIIEGLIAGLKKHPGLRELKEKRKREAIENKLSDDKPLASILENVLKNNSDLSKFLSDGTKVSSPFKKESKQKKDVFIGSKFPTFFELSKIFPESKPKLSQQGRGFRIEFKTDAENNYFSRAVERGSIKLSVSSKGKDIKLMPRVNLWNGKAFVNVDLGKLDVLDEEYECWYEVDDSQRAKPFRGNFYVKVVEYQQVPPSPGGSRKPPGNNVDGGEAESNANLGLPNIIPVEESEWDKYGFDKYDAIAVIADEESHDFFYNRDNVYLRNEQKKSADDEAEVIEAQFKASLVLLGLSMLKERDGEENLTDEIKKSCRSITPVLLPIIRDLGDLDT